MKTKEELSAEIESKISKMQTSAKILLHVSSPSALHTELREIHENLADEIMSLQVQLLKLEDGT